MTPGNPKRMQHTPGPWNATFEKAWGWVVKAGRKYIAWKLVEDDARLISAAHELLESVQQLLEIVRDVPGQNAEIRVQYAEAAIRKARGE